ncbi:hypothetical protein PRK78_002728 [Emydomyces testavorans]|uniref:Aminoglycoside phosphotransferase domain-containing protein n=1 Tax=Emydomyces testavorans TaxID=2070801 RepID=A0AAF0DFG0_9EURO|nr:hypothetical protein PRK78_002728 [Emydomyces testavorans]
MDSSFPPSHVLEAFCLHGTPQQLPGGQGQSYRVGDAVLKPVDDPEETEYISKLQHQLRKRTNNIEYQLAEPIPATFPGDGVYEYVVDGWSAARLVPDCQDPAVLGRQWNRILRAGRAFLEDLAAAVHEPPAFIATRNHRWAKGDRVAWSEEPEENIQSPLAAETVKCQLVHGDLAGNVLFPETDSNEAPAIIDLSLYWRPVEYTEAIVVADGLIWYGEGEDLVRLLGTDEFRLQMLVRALIFRLVASSEAVREGRGAGGDCAFDEPTWLVDFCRRVEKENGVIGGPRMGHRVVKLSDEIAVKYGYGLTAGEAATQQFAYDHVDPSIVRVPRVHHFFEYPRPGTTHLDGFLFMDYIPGRNLKDVDLTENPHIVPQVAKIIMHLQSISGQLPGPIGGGRISGYLWGDYGCKPFHSLDDMNAWLNRRLALRDLSIDLTPYPLVLCHMDLCRRNMILDDIDGRQSIGLVDWGHAGLYPRFFEFTTLSCLNPYDAPYENPLIQSAEALVKLTEEERRLMKLMQVVRAANLRYLLYLSSDDIGID